MILSDQDIERAYANNQLGIDPFKGDRVQPASYDVSLANRLLVFRQDIDTIDPAEKQDLTTEAYFAEYCLEPGEFVLGATEEYIRLPDNLCARIEGKSSLGRRGLVIHSTAGWIDPGFHGNVTLELGNLAAHSIILRPGMKIGQIAFMRMVSPAERPYGHESLGSKYQGSKGAVEGHAVLDIPPEHGWPIRDELREEMEDGS